MDYKKLGVRVREHRKMHNMTQGELAERVGVSASFIGHIERGEKKASLETVVALCNMLEVSPSLLLQDSLNEAAIQSQLSMDEDSLELMSGLMHVLREHTQKREYK